MSRLPRIIRIVVQYDPASQPTVEHGKLLKVIVGEKERDPKTDDLKAVYQFLNKNRYRAFAKLWLDQEGTARRREETYTHA